ncbi:hypothetical protein DAPPUDRAFT_340521, partial [Daphnia pulex]
LQALQQMKDTSCNGETSLQNSFERAMCGLKNMPAHSSREVLTLLVILVIYKKKIKSFKENNIRVSIIGLAAEVRICQEIAKRTGGTYNVLLDDHYLKETLILNQVQPLAVAGTMEASLVKMGFSNNSGYNCPQSGSRYCELPVECKQCGLTLVSAPHLARSYHLLDY